MSVSSEIPGPFRLQGEVDLASTRDWRVRLHAYAAACEGDVVADCTGLEFLDSTGIAMLIAFRAELESRGRHFQLVGVDGVPKRALEVCGLDGWFNGPIRSAELTPTAAEVLRHMAEMHPHVLLQEAVREVALPEPAIADALAELCAAGFVGRTPARPGIAEAFRITPAGRRKACRLN